MSGYICLMCHRLYVSYIFILKKFCKWFCRCQHLLHRLLPLPRCWRARSFSAAAKWDFGRLCHCLQECPSMLSHFAKYLILPTSLPSVLWFTAQHFLLETCDLSDLWGFVIWGHLLLPHFQGVLDLKHMWMSKRKRRLLQGTTVAAAILGMGLGATLVTRHNHPTRWPWIFKNLSLRFCVLLHLHFLWKQISRSR